MVKVLMTEESEKKLENTIRVGIVAVLIGLVDIGIMIGELL
jgi:hypothetical protein